MITVKSPKYPDVTIPSIHPLLWMAREFIRNVPIEKLPKELIEIWKDYQGCAFKSIETAIQMLTPVRFIDRDLKCLNQRIQIVIDPQIIKPIEFRSEGE